MAFPLSGVLGLGGSLLGGLFGADEADAKRKGMISIAKTPGVDLGEIYGEAFDAMGGALPRAQDLISTQNRFNAAELDALLEGSIPGLKGMQATRAGNTASFLRGELPDDVARSVFRGSTGRALEGGYGGSGFGRNLVARDLGRTSLDLMQLGAYDLDRAVGSAPLPKILSTQDLVSIGPRETLGLRSGERSERIGNLMAAYGQPTGNQVWGSVLQDMGGSLFGSGGGWGGIMKGLNSLF